MSQLNIQEHYKKIKQRYPKLPDRLHDWQEDALKKLLADRQNVLGIFPTGSGKSLLFTISSLLADQIDETVSHITLVVSPLRSLMKDQLSHLRNVGVSCAGIFKRSEMTDEEVERIKTGSVSVILTSPEAILENQWRRTVKSLRSRIALFVCDEVHCIPLWGETFRESYHNIQIMRSIVTSPWLLLSATCTQKMVTTIKEVLALDDLEIVGRLPDRPEIFLEFVKTGSDYRRLDWLIRDIKMHGSKTKKTIIYCPSTVKVSKLHEWVMACLGSSAWVNCDAGCKVFENRVVTQFHKSVTDVMSETILKAMSDPESNLRILISTVAFGMGIDIPDIEQVIHWGFSNSIAHYWQEVGRCARRITRGCAIFYSVRMESEEKEFVQSIKEFISVRSCFRKMVLQHFTMPGVNDDVLEALDKRVQCQKQCLSCQCSLCMCCSECRCLCPCVLNLKSLAID